mmetsp:Transcript_24072/g.41428  ORF Transcript_24072/g.41428 Transcript_24072/m.41428 type:complete len:279 (+) Transcript_24072:89-925(+)|eukprot:CAMPEP_0196653856 /NCGR_PEP_ID=MMETSP1086-20130531/3519_1 /TAXON_ID=77921 /ORGANISM="Cyanoptyche  gloeocystis , Strain SAG4.97" /LENGTH=278 /DNA_ID=CAMNT_0041985261 /DNA_START=78 /DNA_END=914 /DNA_ORIENTATION=+
MAEASLHSFVEVPPTWVVVPERAYESAPLHRLVSLLLERQHELEEVYGSAPEDTESPDTNLDGKISNAELNRFLYEDYRDPDSYEACVSKYDANEDRLLSNAEHEACVKAGLITGLRTLDVVESYKGATIKSLLTHMYETAKDLNPTAKNEGDLNKNGKFDANEVNTLVTKLFHDEKGAQCDLAVHDDNSNEKIDLPEFMDCFKGMMIGQIILINGAIASQEGQEGEAETEALADTSDSLVSVAEDARATSVVDGDFQIEELFDVEGSADQALSLDMW